LIDRFSRAGFAELDQSAKAALRSLYASNPAAQAVGKKAKAILVFPSIVKGGVNSRIEAWWSVGLSGSSYRGLTHPPYRPTTSYHYEPSILALRLNKEMPEGFISPGTRFLVESPTIVVICL
jgi:hypothetical protein